MNMVVPILMHFYPCLPFKSFSNQSMQAACYLTKCDVNNVELCSEEKFSQYRHCVQ